LEVVVTGSFASSPPREDRRHAPGPAHGSLGAPLAILVIAILAAACNTSAASPSPSTAPPQSQAAAATSAPRTAAPTATTPAVKGTFHLEKTCSGTECTVTMSSLAAIPVGTAISYSGPGMNALTATVKVQGGDATGTCDISTLPGACTFTTGTGTLAKFPAKVVVTQTGPTWFWDGDLRP
jgi:hypothetical protein